MSKIGSVNYITPSFRADASAQTQTTTSPKTDLENDKFENTQKNKTNNKKTDEKTNCKIIASAIVPGLGQAIEGRWGDALKYFGIACGMSILTVLSCGLLLPAQLAVNYFAAKDVYNEAIKNQV